MKGPFRELIPIGPQKVRLKLPEGSKVKKVHLLSADRKPDHHLRDGWLETTVPSILDHEILAVDL